MLNAEVISPENAFPCFPVIILDDDDLEYDEILVIVLTSGDFSVAVIPEGRMMRIWKRKLRGRGSEQVSVVQNGGVVILMVFTFLAALNTEQ